MARPRLTAVGHQECVPNARHSLATLFGSRLGRREKRLSKVPRLRSGFRLRAPARLAASLTPAKRLNFTKKGPHAVGPLEPLIAKGLPLSGTLAAGFVSARGLDFKELSPLALQNPYAFVCPQRLQRLNFTKTGLHSVLPFETLISLGLGANGSGTDWFDPFVLASAALQGRL